jgi:hypothetical protein
MVSEDAIYFNSYENRNILPEMKALLFFGVEYGNFYADL